MKNTLIISCIISTILLVSCKKADEKATGTGDVITITKKIADKTVYGISLYAYTYSSFQSVKVSTSDPAKNYTLKANQGYKTNFYYEAPDALFATTKPTAETYKFSAVFENGATDEFQDELTGQVLELPIIEKAVYNSNLRVVDIQWNLVPDADSYAINIFDGNNLVFSTPELAKTIKSFMISAAGNGWATGFTPLSGKTYTIKLFAFLYESGGNAYNVQATSYSEKSFEWGN